MKDSLTNTRRCRIGTLRVDASNDDECSGDSNFDFSESAGNVILATCHDVH